MAFTIAHFSDIHITIDPRRVPWRALLSKRLVGWANLRFCGRFAALRDAAEVTRALVDDVLRLAPDHVLVTGDLTGLALAAEFEAAHRTLRPLLDATLAAEPPTITGIPGNHDVYVRRALREGNYRRLFGAWECSERTGSPPIVRILGDDVALIALVDSRPAAPYDSSGRVGREQLARLDALLDDPEIRERRRIVALHYGLCESDGRPGGRFHGLRDAPQLIDVLRGRVDLVVHGHLHDRFVSRDASSAGVPIANPGSATDARHERAYHVIEVERAAIRVLTRRFDAARSQFVEWPGATGPREL